MKRSDWKFPYTASPESMGVVIWTLIVLLTGVIVSIEYWDWITGGESGSALLRNLALAATAVVGLPIAIWRSKVAERQADAARQQAEIAHDDWLSKRYQRNSEMLDSDKVWVRVAGIAELARLAQDHPSDYHVQVMELLCTFVRHSSRREEQTEHDRRYGEEDVHESEDVRSPRIAVRSALRVIGSRSDAHIAVEAQAEFKLNLNGSDLRSENLYELNLSRARLERANLSDAVLGRTNFSDAHLLGANLSGSKMGGANFVGANLSFSIMRDIESSVLADFSDAILDSADLTGAQVAGARFSGANFSNTNLAGTVFYKRDRTVAEGLTQNQFKSAVVKRGGQPPFLGQLTDCETGDRICWCPIPQD